jgi:hypothetical protein
LSSESHYWDFGGLVVPLLGFLGNSTQFVVPFSGFRPIIGTGRDLFKKLEPRTPDLFIKVISALIRLLFTRGVSTRYV